MGPILRSVLGLVVTRYATRSLPRAALIGGGLVVKAMFDRRRARKSGEEPKSKRSDKGAAN